ncbi:TPA: DEAD/DEAH box helicase [Pseudomonas aeruginosa]|uniref:DEAD/DEAH box helicase n=1 Tax=Pseudomonas aeruginosa TaxID=287 RepID=UPI001968A5A7|nr:DEAD/DEAH box helicase [Pseudomonas aeruginosa]EKB8023345.1 DEAD/DEAH box helicase [Pseudomonas aeruginosa]EKT7964278.1 DEAD/DEAH box helicase [Pseudomonas aeruginosa]MBV6100765.1 DEAD/DEAH box helicase [Pseudomonas aeruginosa]MCK1836132.1 DEAD/DEAH box helicase [Pseudomonas aeruginosa]HBO1920501.1 DEAD/DEAH box helicase [Pseudomonas aeruginosa]
MLRFSYRATDQRALIAWDDADVDRPWLPLARALFSTASVEAQGEGGNAISLPWWSFVGLRAQINQFLQSFNMCADQDYLIDTLASELLRQSARNTASYKNAIAGEKLDEQELMEKLQAAKFGRTLKKHQIRNVCTLASLPAGATFSVPGAGKTTEALATFTYRRQPGDRLLIIAPKNAFAAWDEQLQECFPDTNDVFVRLRGSNISRALHEDPPFMLISYQQMALSRDLIIPHVARHRVHVFLDESHRIKAGPLRKTAQAVLSLSQFPVGKLVMSGTPMPQSRDDLLPQFSFLYPEIPATVDNVVERMRPIYVRTNKGELGLPPVTHLRKSLPMSPLQLELYRFMKSEVARQATEYLSDRGRQAFRLLGRSVMRLLMFVSHPALLSREIDFAKPGLLAAVLAEGKGPKMNYVLHRARELARQGNKVLIWSSFRHNVEYIADSLQDLGAVYIHGGVDAGDEDDDGTREGKIKRFHDDENVRVMVANPAAASEGVSLHTVCHHALYLDRTFNAAQFLQSMDRIHRLGLPPRQATTIEVVECSGSIDETVQWRLKTKIDAMAAALNDTTLQIDPIPMDPEMTDDDEDWSGGGMDAEDVQALLRDLSGIPRE